MINRESKIGHDGSPEFIGEVPGPSTATELVQKAAGILDDASELTSASKAALEELAGRLSVVERQIFNLQILALANRPLWRRILARVKGPFHA